MSKGSRLLAGAAAVLTSFALIASAQGRMVGGIGPQADSGTAYFAITHSKGGLEYAAGNNVDKLLGTGAATYALKLLPGRNGSFRVTSKNVVFYTGKGSLSGTATATVDVTSTKETITGGKLDLTKGLGSLKGDELTVRFTGTADLKANQFVFKYKGTLFS